MVLHGKTYAATGVRTSDENNLVLIAGSGGARSWTREICSTTSDADAARIVSCVNAMAGIDDPVVARQSLDAADGLLAALKAMLEVVKGVPEMQTREFVSLCIQVNAAIAKAERAPFFLSRMGGGE